MPERKVKQMIQSCYDFYQKKLVCSSGGNVSIRSDKFIYITPTGVSLEKITIDNLVKLDFNGNIISDGKPSKEYKMHLKIYQNNDDCQIVVHVHSPYIIAVSCMSKPNTMMPVYTPGYASRIGYIKILPFFVPGTEQLSNAVAEELKMREAVILMNHGLVVWGKDFEKVRHIVEEVEENAKIFIYSGGKGNPLSEEEINKVRNQVY